MNIRTTILAFVLGVAATLLVAHLYQRAGNNAPRVPPWEPFELRSDLTLDDLVADGYRFSDMPCGMIHFSKTIGDTTMRYWVNIDCADYSGKYLAPDYSEVEWNEEEVVPPMDAPSDTSSTEPNQAPDFKRFELDRKQNPYWPFDPDSVRQCYQHLNWRHYWFTMETMDSLAIRQWVEQHDGFMYTEDWNCSDGGSFVVKHLTNNLTFNVRVRRGQDKEGNFLPWEITIISDIPFLDQERYEAYQERQELMYEYYDTE